MKIYTKVVIDMETLETIYEESYEYTGPMAYLFGGTGSGVTGASDADREEGDAMDGNDASSDDDGGRGNQLSGQGVGDGSGPANQINEKVDTESGQGMGTGWSFTDEEESTAGEPDRTWYQKLGDKIIGKDYFAANLPKVDHSKPVKEKYYTMTEQAFKGGKLTATDLYGAIMKGSTLVGAVPIGMGMKAWQESVEDFNAATTEWSDQEKVQGLASLYQMEDERGGLGRSPSPAEGDTGDRPEDRDYAIDETSTVVPNDPIVAATDDDLTEYGYTEDEIKQLRGTPQYLREMDPYLMMKVFPSFYDLLYVGNLKHPLGGETTGVEKTDGFKLLGKGTGDTV